jgi:hypothetical protein
MVGVSSNQKKYGRVLFYEGKSEGNTSTNPLKKVSEIVTI